jgi:hypothetical protein
MARSFGLKVKLTFTYVFNVDASVGSGGTNKREDVLLVQYLLAVWMSREKDPRLIPLIIGKEPTRIDGIFGNKTKDEIKTFEIIHADRVVSDGIVHPMTAGSGLLTSKQKATKLFLLNQELFLAGGLRGGVPESRIPFPAELIAPLFR